jgi:hypothetical protein
MSVPLRTYGSLAVSDAYEDLILKINDFFFAVTTFRQMREQRAAELPWREVENNHRQVREAHRALVRLANDELAAL